MLWDHRVVNQRHNQHLVSLPVQLTEKGDRQIRIHVITICEVDLIKISSQMNVNIKHIHYHDCYLKKICYLMLVWRSSIFSNIRKIVWHIYEYVLVLYCSIFFYFYLRNYHLFFFSEYLNRALQSHTDFKCIL